MKKSVDIVVLGATGYTGKFTVKYLASLTVEKYFDVKWAIAGRSKKKLENVVKELNETGSAIKDLTIIECDIENGESLKKMLKVAKVVINCTGPNVLLSPPIVKACIEAGTHYVDITAELLHMYKLYRDYNKLAEDSNVLIIPSCGFASLPSEAGMIYLEKQFKGTLHTVECYTELLLPTLWPRTVLHNGTWTSVVYALETYKEHLALKRELFPVPIEPEPEEIKRSFFFRNNRRSWFPWPGPDAEVTEMSQRYLYEKTQKRAVHIKQYTTVQTFIHFFAIPFMFMYYYLCYFSCFRKLLINYPWLCTFGFVSKTGPTDKTREGTKYVLTLNGKGWGLDSDLNSKPTKTLSVKVSGQDPAYNTTAVAVVMCAITILKESSNMPKGGVVMPGAAFFKTDIVDRLMHDGFTFEVLNSSDDNTDKPTIKVI